MGPIQSLDELIMFLRRRAPLIAVVMVVGVLGALAFALSQPRSYATQATIQVRGSAMGADMAASSPTLSGARRLQQLEQQLMSRDNLLALASDYDLFPGLTPQERVDAMRQSIRFEVVAAIRERATIGNTATSQNRSLTATVAEAFATNAEVSLLRILVETGTPGSAAALANDLAGAVLQENAENVSDSVRSVLEFYQREEARLLDELALLGEQIVEFKSQNFELLPESTAARRVEQASVREALLTVQRDKAALQEEISQLEDRENALRATEARRLNAARDELSAADRRERQLQEQSGELQRLISAAPRVTAELDRLERREEQLQEQVSDLAERRLRASLGERMDEDQNTERFELLEAAIPPDYPSSGSRSKLAIMGAMGAAMGALLLAYLLEILQPVLRNSAQIERALGMRPVMVLPAVRTRAEDRRIKLAWTAGTGLAALGALAVLIAFGG